MDDPKFNPETGLYERVGEGSQRGGQEVERKRDKGQERERGEQERNREEEQEPTVKRKWGEKQEINGEKLGENERRRSIGKVGEEKEKGAGGGGEHQLWAGCLFDSHCHLNLVLR